MTGRISLSTTMDLNKNVNLLVLNNRKGIEKDPDSIIGKLSETQRWIQKHAEMCNQ